MPKLTKRSRALSPERVNIIRLVRREAKRYDEWAVECSAASAWSSMSLAVGGRNALQELAVRLKGTR